jgi:putative endonuclease
MELFKVYIIKSLKVERYYIGSTSDLEKRVSSHNSTGARWTKRFQPWEVVFTEEYTTGGEAVKREKFLKSLKNIRKFLKVDES